MKLYSHALDFSYEIKSSNEDGSDITGAQMRKAMLEKLEQLSDEDLLQCCNVFDSMDDEK